MDKYTIDVSSEESITIPNGVEETLVFAMEYLSVKPAEVSVSFISDEAMQTLNLEYRTLDEPTDVLSFAQEENPFPFAQSPILGDIVISLDTMERNALLFGVEPAVEVKRLLIHGLLHLLGHDHATNESDEAMLVLQEEILAQLLRSER
ncbi:MAG: rRNA maturation RNase YbeY [Sphaerochaeta sp.]